LVCAIEKISISIIEVKNEKLPDLYLKVIPQTWEKQSLIYKKKGAISGTFPSASRLALSAHSYKYRNLFFTTDIDQGFY